MLGSGAMRLALVGGLALVAGEAPAQEPDLEAVTKTAPPCDPARKHCLALQLHVAVADSGPVATVDWVARQLQQANRHFAPLDVSFQVAGVSALPADAARIEDAKERTSLALRVAGTVIDVFVTAQFDDIKDSAIYGVTWPKGSKKCRYSSSGYITWVRIFWTILSESMYRSMKRSSLLEFWVR